MVRMSRNLVWTLLLAMALMVAGCSGSPSSSSDIDPEVPPSLEDGTGAIEGIVTDEENLPVGGAQIGLAAIERTATSRADTGFYRLSGIPAGSHTIYVNRLGFEALAVKVTIVAGETLTQAFVLQALPSSDPHHQLDTHSGHIDLAYRIQSPVFTEGRVIDTGTLDFMRTFSTTDVVDAMQYVHVEQVWQGTQALAAGMRLRVESSDGTNNLARTFCIIDSPASPGLCTAPPEEVQKVASNSGTCKEGGAKCTIQWRAFTGAGKTGQAVDFGLMFDQDFTVYATVFYNGEMPSDYHARPDA
jgi:hypothetical protein